MKILMNAEQPTLYNQKMKNFDLPKQQDPPKQFFQPKKEELKYGDSDDDNE